MGRMGRSVSEEMFICNGLKEGRESPVWTFVLFSRKETIEGHHDTVYGCFEQAIRKV